MDISVYVRIYQDARCGFKKKSVVRSLEFDDCVTVHR
jgi:hypothetical protein